MLPHKTLLRVVFLVLFIGSSVSIGNFNNATSLSSSQYHTTYKELPSPDWFLPVRVFLNMFASTSIADDIWTSSHVNNVTKVDFEKIAGPMVGMVILASIGIVFAVVTTVGGILLCCCRICNNCGGNYEQSLKNSQSSHCRYMLSSILFFALLVSLVALIYMYFSLPLKKEFISDYTKSLDDNFVDLQVYVNNSRQEIDVLINNDLVVTLQEESYKLQKFGFNIGVQIHNDLIRKSNIVAVLADLSNIANAVDQLYGLMVEIQNEISGLNDEVTSLNSEISLINSLLADFVQNCTVLCKNDNCNDACQNINATHYQMNFNLTSLSLDLSGELEILRNVVDKNLINATESYGKNFENIPLLVTSAAQPSMNEISEMLNDATDFVIETVHNLDTFFNQLAYSISTYDDSFKIVEDNVDVADSVLFGVSLTICLLLTLIWILFTCGLFGGTVTFNRNVLPTERNGVSDCFGLLLLIATGLTFCVSGILWLITAIMSIPGSGIYLVVCQALFDDKFALLDSLTKNNIIVIPTEFTFNVSSVLDSCQNNYSAFYSFGLIDSVDMNATLFNDLDNMTVVWNLSDASHWDLELDDSDMNGTLIEFNSAIDYDFTSYLNDISNVLSTQLGYLTSCLDNITVDLAVFDNNASQVQRLSYEIENFNISSHHFITSINNLNSSIQNWTCITADQQDQVSVCLSSLPNISHLIENGVDNAVIQYSIEFVNHLNHAISDLINTLYHDVGNCWSLWVIFQSLRVTTCRNVIDPVNSFWFNMGTALFFFLVAVVPALKLSKYFRTMKFNRRGKSDALQRQTPISRRPEKINQTRNGYFDDIDVIPTIDKTVKHPTNNKIQPIIDAFEQRPLPNLMAPPDLVRGNAFLAPSERDATEPAIRLSAEQLEIYQKIPRVSTQNSPPSVNYLHLLNPYENSESEPRLHLNSEPKPRLYSNSEPKPRLYSKPAPIPPPRAKPVRIPIIPPDKDYRYD